MSNLTPTEHITWGVYVNPIRVNDSNSPLIWNRKFMLQAPVKCITMAVCINPVGVKNLCFKTEHENKKTTLGRGLKNKTNIKLLKDNLYI